MHELVSAQMAHAPLAHPHALYSVARPDRAVAELRELLKALSHEHAAARPEDVLREVHARRSRRRTILAPSSPPRLRSHHLLAAGLERVLGPFVHAHNVNRESAPSRQRETDRERWGGSPPHPLVGVPRRDLDMSSLPRARCHDDAPSPCARYWASRDGFR